MSDNKPIIQDRDRVYSISIFRKERADATGKMQPYYGACLQRSFKRKDSQEWEREQINLFPEDLLRIAALCERTHNDLTLWLESWAKQNGKQTTEYPAQTMDEDVPF